MTTEQRLAERRENIEHGRSLVDAVRVCVKDAVLKERERCAKIVEDMCDEQTADRVAAEIRKGE